MDPSLTIQPQKEKNPEFYCHFTLEGIHASLANALRRIMISEIPTVGFRCEKEGEQLEPDKKDIHVLQNTGALHNEFMSHRLSMIPLAFYKDKSLFIASSVDPTTKKRHYFYQDSSKNVTRDKYQLNVVNKETDKSLSVFTSDITHIDGKKKPECIQPDPTLGENNYIILTKLKPSEKLHVHLQPSIGLGQENSLFSPVGTVAYKFVQESDDQIKKALAKKIEMVNDERSKKKIEILSEEETKELERDFGLLDSKRVYKKDSDGNATTFDFQVESNGGLPVLNIIETAIEVLYHKIYDIHSVIQKDESGAYTFLKEGMMITRSPTRMVGYDITIPNEDHTLGNLITKYMQNFYLRSDQGSGKSGSVFEFVSYQKPHPLENKIVFRFQLLASLVKDSKEDESTVVQYFVETLEKLMTLIGSGDMDMSTESEKKSIYQLFQEQKAQAPYIQHYTDGVITWIR